MKRIIHFVFILGIFFMTGCTLYEKPEVPCIEAPDHFKSAVKKPNLKLKERWWENFNDAKLNCLVELAIKNNYNYKITLENIRIAGTFVTQNMSDLFPQVNLSFNSSRNKLASVISNSIGGNNNAIRSNIQKPSSIFNLQELTGSVSYEVDVWNKIRNSVKQAKANQCTSEAESKIIKLALISNVVNTYFQIVNSNTNIINLNKQYHFANEIVSLINVQFRNGLIDASTLDNAKIQAESIKANISSLEKQRQILQYTLAYLVGEYPENFDFTLTVNKSFKELQTKKLIPCGIPSEMIANRPDIQATYYQILSYGYLEKQNIANFLPSISLTGNYGYASTGLSQLISNTNSYWNYGAYVTQFIFDYQTRISQYRRSKYQYQAAILSYKNTVLNAFLEVDSALSSYKEDNKALISYQKQVGDSKDLLSLANSQHRSGLTDYSTYLTANLNYLQSSYNLTNQKLIVIEDIIQIYKTLGLGLR